jgi:hypothetical protein
VLSLEPLVTITSVNLPPAKRKVALRFPSASIVPPAVKPPVAIRLATPEPGLVVMAVKVSVLVVVVAAARVATASAAAAAVAVAMTNFAHVCLLPL